MKKLLLAAVVAALSFTSNSWAVTIYDLTSPPETTVTIDGVNFIASTSQPSGTGYIKPFLRLQDTPTEQGYNTVQPNNPLMPFETKAGYWTHEVLLSNLVSSGGYYEFKLDIAESNSDNERNGDASLLSLDGLKLFATSDPYQNSEATDGSGNASGITGTLLWNMDALADNSVVLDAARFGSTGNGTSDMILQVPVAELSGGTADEIYFILWSRFGLLYTSDGYLGAGSDSSFEEWAAVEGTPPIPEPGTMILVGAGFLGLAIYGKRRRNNA